jgi:TatD DNase family protein
MLIDTHCHIHESEFYSDEERQAVYQRALSEGVQMICIGTSEATSREAVDFANTHPRVWAVIGVHPHDSKAGYTEIETLLKEKSAKVVGIGEIGLDYFYMNSPRDVQIAALEQQLQWAIDYSLPVSFHVRDSFDDFWPILGNFQHVRGVLHSFTDSLSNMERGLLEGLYMGVNGISTFTKDVSQQEMYDAIPVDRLLFETDAPFLTPMPHRGKVNEPAYVRFVAQFHANRRNQTLNELVERTTHNAQQLFSL